MNKVMAMTALAASLLVSSAAHCRAPNLADALQPASGLTLVKGGGGGGGGGVSAVVAAYGRRRRGLAVGGGHIGAVAALAAAVMSPVAAAISAATPDRISAAATISAASAWPETAAGPRYGANDHAGNGHNHYDDDHFDHDHGRHVRFFPGDAFFYGGDYADYGYYGGDCGWLARQARATGSAYWWRRYNECALLRFGIGSRRAAGPFPSAPAGAAAPRRR